MEITDIKKIALFRALNLGDMLCIIPTVRAIKSALPEASLTLVGLPSQKTFATRFKYYFDNFIEFPGWPGLPEQPFDAKRSVDFLKYMQQLKFDLVLQMQGNGTITNTMCILWGAKMVAGLRRQNEYCPAEKYFPVSEDDEHEVKRFLKIADALGISQQGFHLEFPFSQEEENRFIELRQQLGLSPQHYICLHPGARDERRRWAPGNFALVGDFLAAKGYTIVLTGSNAEAALLEEVSRHMQHAPVNTIALLGDVNLGDLAVLIKHTRLLVSNDTGVSHIAAALKVPSVIIFSPFSLPRRWAPLDQALHKGVSAGEAKNVHRVIQHIQQQLTQFSKESSLLLH